MNLFISYSSNERDLCERLRLALEAEGHTVFVDRAELKEGEPYHEALRQAIEDADALIFLITPRAVAPGSYALTELDLAQRQWRRPAGRVLPVIVEPTPIASIPPYLRSVTLLQPKGDPVAETVAAVARLRRGPGWRPLAIGAAVAVLAVAAGLGWWAREQQRVQADRAREAAAQEALQREVKVVAGLCATGSHAMAWDQFTRIASRAPGDAELRTAREDCGMAWLREMRTVSDKESFGAQVDRIQPVLAEGLTTARGARAADLRAHLGWGNFLRSRDGVSSPPPVPQYEAALRDDPANVYAHAMWAHHLVWTRNRLDDEARRHFDAAVASGRERAWVRTMQFASGLGRRDLAPYTLVVASDMRAKGETIERDRAATLWRYVIDGPWLMPNERPALLAALPPAELLATFEWLFPKDGLRDEQRPLWRLCVAQMRAATGDLETAAADREALQRELKAAGDDGRVSREVGATLVAWGKAPARRPGATR